MPYSIFETSRIWLSSSLAGGFRSRPVLTLGSVFLCLLLFSRPAVANNVTLSNVELVDQDTSAETVGIEFDLSWSNAWKDSTNHDSVWAFAKYCTSNCSTNGVWSHATLKTAGVNPTGFSCGERNSGAFMSLDLIVPSDKKGAFIQSASVGSGTVDFQNVKLIWDYGQDGVSDSDATGGDTAIRVFVIEMVYVPQGGFYVGDGSAGTYGEIEHGPEAASMPGTISSEDALEFQNVTGTAAGLNQWFYNTDTGGDDAASGAVFQVGEPFPKGFKAFYAMKYEISQGQYRDFLNTLNRAAQKNRVAGDISGDAIANYYVMSNNNSVVNRQGIRAPGSGNGTTDPVAFGCDLNGNGVFDEAGDGEWVAMNYLSWMDLAAFADWAGLRPLTELEYEKLCRGSLYPVDGGYPWGTTDLTQAQGAVSAAGQAGELAANAGNGLANFDGAGTDVLGPLRSGFAATSTTTERLTSGSGFYGAMDLSGNLWERTVTIGNSAGRGFSGTHGDGVLTTLSSYEGNATNLDWPGISGTNSQGVTGAVGSGSRGGAWDSTITRYLEVSNREFAGTTNVAREAGLGGRLGRTAS